MSASQKKKKQTKRLIWLISFFFSLLVDVERLRMNEWMDEWHDGSAQSIIEKHLNFIEKKGGSMNKVNGCVDKNRIWVFNLRCKKEQQFHLGKYCCIVELTPFLNQSTYSMGNNMFRIRKSYVLLTSCRYYRNLQRRNIRFKLLQNILLWNLVKISYQKIILLRKQFASTTSYIFLSIWVS